MKSTKTKTDKPKLNVKLLRKIQKHILEEPRRLVMRALVIKPEDNSKEFMGDYERKQKFAACGTAACIAGWALILSGRQDVLGNYGAIDAAELLGTGSYDIFAPDDTTISGRLFWDAHWPEPFRDAYKNAKTPEQRAKVAAARIDYLIKTGS